ncbi:MAG TPA: hypothetical protein VGD62_12330 [Acidobacteriaceae bacterium]
MLTAIWQSHDNRENDWIAELFGDHIQEHVYDCSHALVMDNCIVLDKFIHKNPPAYYQQFRDRTNVFLFHLSDEHYHGGYQAYQYFNGVFRTCWSSIFKPSVMQLPLGYSNGVKLDHPPKLSSERTHLWSFVGETERATRPEMIKALASVRPHLNHSTDQGPSTVLSPSAYKTILEETVFAPSPMGRLNMECFRTYEALECGSIPIVEKRATLDFYKGLLGPNPLLTVRRWSHAPALMRELTQSPAALNALQAEIASWWKATKLRLAGEVSAVIESRAHSPKSAAPSTRAYYRLPLWQQVHLARHHSATALARRARLEALRLVFPVYREGSAK